MEIHSRIEKKTLTVDLLSIHISPKEKDTIVEILGSVIKKAKLDRFEEYVINNLIDAFQNPAIEKEEPFEGMPEPQETKQQTTAPAVNFPELPVADKVRIVGELKKRLDPKDEKSINIFIRESIDYAQKSIGIKTVPKSNSVESFYDWLLENNIIDQYGNPKRV